MNKLSILLISLACASCGDNAVVPDMPTVDLSMPDLTPVIDMAMIDSAGLQCGQMTCPANNDCCLERVGNGFTSMCMPSGTCQQDGGTVLTCDGPEDCTPATAPNCCIGIDFVQSMADGGTPSGSANSACTKMCPGSATIGNSMGHINSKLCHVKNDCANYTGVVNYNNMVLTLPFTSCCSSMQTGDLMFCAPGVASMAGLTCN